VPKSFIDYFVSISGAPLQFYSCFISYSQHDERFAQRLNMDLAASGIRSWLFAEDAKWGTAVWGEIDRSIRIHDKVIVVCSRWSLKSMPVLREIERALQREDREHREVLFPVRLDNYVFDRWEHPRKADVLAKVVGDFSKWKTPKSYLTALNRLRESLTKAATAPTSV